jgi:ATP-binding cassette, subfamily B, bacterial
VSATESLADAAPSSTKRRDRLGTLAFNWWIIRAEPWSYALHFAGQLLVLFVPVGLGLIERAVFDAITGGAPTGRTIWWFVALYVALGVGRFGAEMAEAWGSWTFRRAVGRRLRHYLLAGLLRRPGAAPLPVSPGEVVNRFRVDVDEVSDFPTWFPNVVGNVAAFVVAVWIMGRINLAITLIVFLPLAVGLVIGRMAWTWLHVLNQAELDSQDAVIGLLAEILGAVQAVKLAGAEVGVVERYRALNRSQAWATVRSHLLWEAITSMSTVSATFGVGATLILAGHLLAAGHFTVGDFALFVTYLGFTTDLPTFLGTFAGDYQYQGIALRRLGALLGLEEQRSLVDVAPVISPDPPSGPLESLTIRNLTYRYPGAGRGIVGVDLDLPRGSFVVVTGRIGSGKTTFVRVLVGLLPRDAGEICWNGQSIADAAAFFRPPRAAYVPQVPRLISAPVRENVLLGFRTEDGELAEAVCAAVLDPDLAALERGLDTVVGPRGVRLSGGQVQRVAAARSLVRAPELLICDDLASALDVGTERALWEDLRRREGLTCVVVSHRRSVLARADWIVVVENGRVEAQGKLDDLMATSAELRRVWEGRLE